MRRLSLVLVTAAVLVLLAPAFTATAGGNYPSGKEVQLSGCLTKTDETAYQYRLLEQKSGDSIPVKGTQMLADHIDHKVELTGKWNEDVNKTRFFEVTSVKMIANSCRE